MCDECKAHEARISALSTENARLNDQLDAIMIRQFEAEQALEQLRTENQHLSDQYHRALFPLQAANLTPTIDQQIKARIKKAAPRVSKVHVSETQASIIMACLRSRRIA